MMNTTEEFDSGDSGDDAVNFAALSQEITRLRVTVETLGKRVEVLEAAAAERHEAIETLKVTNTSRTTGRSRRIKTPAASELAVASETAPSIDELGLGPFFLTNFRVHQVADKPCVVFPTYLSDRTPGQFRVMRRIARPGAPRYKWGNSEELQRPPGYNLPHVLQKLTNSLRNEVNRGSARGNDKPNSPEAAALQAKERNTAAAKAFAAQGFNISLDAWIVTDELDVWVMQVNGMLAVSLFDDTGHEALIEELANSGVVMRLHIALSHDLSGRKGSVALAKACKKHGINCCIYSLVGKQGHSMCHEYRDVMCDRAKFRSWLDSLTAVSESTLALWESHPEASLSSNDFKRVR